MSRRIPRAGALLPVALIVLLAAGTAVARGQTNRVVLRVNDEIATLYDYEQLKKEQLAAIARAELPEQRKQEILARIGEETMRQLFEEMLVLSRADQLGVEVPPGAVDEAMREAMASFGIDSVEQFAAGLEQSGMTLARWREQMRRSMTVREVMGREIPQRVSLEEEDLRRYYRAHSEEFRRPRRVKLREIVVLDDETAGEQEHRALAEELAALALAGDPQLEARLAELEEGGRTSGWIDLGWVLAGDLDPRLEPVVGALDSGGVSEPTRARGGLHVLQALEVEESHIEEFQAVRDRIERQERERLFEQEAQGYLEELVANSYVESSPPPEAAGFRPQLGPAAPSAGAEEGG